MRIEKTYFKDTCTSRMLVELNNAHEEIRERRCLNVAEDVFDDIRLCLDEREHLKRHG